MKSVHADKSCYKTKNNIVQVCRRRITCIIVNDCQRSIIYLKLNFYRIYVINKMILSVVKKDMRLSRKSMQPAF